MILIEVNRWTILKLEEAIDKYNEDHERIGEYSEMINQLLKDYLE